jgi:NAD(P)H-dependent FMN reductase
VNAIAEAGLSLKLNIIIASTRPGRKGPVLGRWIREVADADEHIDANLIDLADFALPVYDEPHHPMLRTYEHAHTQRWAASVASADAYVLVTPEYNYSAPPSLINALTYVYWEWNYKPAGFVSYGGLSGGMRAVQSVKPLLTTLKIMPIPEAVVAPLFTQSIGADGAFRPSEVQLGAAKQMLAELRRWADALAPLRAK